MYTCLYESSISGETCFDPLFFHYPQTDDTFDEQAISSSIIAANALKVSPVLEAGVKTYQSYFPNGSWVNMKHFEDVMLVNETEGGKWVTLDAPSELYDTVNVHLKPGSIISFQENRNREYKTTADVLANASLALVVNRNMPHNYASGTVFFDSDGESLSDLTDNLFEYYRFQLSAKTLSKQVLNNQTIVAIKNLEKVVITDASDLADTDFACMTNFFTREVTTLKYEYDSTTLTLNISSQDGEGIIMKNLRDIHFGTKARDINLCDPSSNYYKSESVPDLTKPSESITLVGQLPEVVRNLTLSMSVL